jgi:ribosomal protein L9
MKIKVLLLKDVAWLGGKGQLVEVSDAMFRNVLSKKWEAKIADKKTIKDWERKQARKEEEQHLIDEKKHKAVEAMKENGLELKVPTNWEHLYEKIDIRHIINWIFDQHKIKFSEREIDFPEKKVNKLWEYDFFVKIDWKKVALKLKVLTK